MCTFSNSFLSLALTLANRVVLLDSAYWWWWLFVPVVAPSSIHQFFHHFPKCHQTLCDYSIFIFLYSRALLFHRLPVCNGNVKFTTDFSQARLPLVSNLFVIFYLFYPGHCWFRLYHVHQMTVSKSSTLVRICMQTLCSCPPYSPRFQLLIGNFYSIFLLKYSHLLHTHARVHGHKPRIIAIHTMCVEGEKNMQNNL